MDIVKYWVCSLEELGEDLLPAAGAALDPDVARVPDTVEQATSFFSIGFRGKDLANSSVRFSTFKQLLDNFYDVARKILGPKLIEGSKSATFDFRIVPKIGSLIISVEEPIFNYGRIEQKLSETSLSFDDIKDQVDEQRGAFFDGLRSAVSAVEHGEANADLSEEAKHVLEDVLYIIPNEDYRFASIEFTAKSSGGINTVFINNETGGRIRRALDRSSFEPGTRIGAIVEINAEANTFIIKSRTGRLTTCASPADIFRTMKDEGLLELGVRLTVSGNLQKRKRRDRIFIQKYPELVP